MQPLREFPVKSLSPSGSTHSQWPELQLVFYFIHSLPEGVLVWLHVENPAGGLSGFAQGPVNPPETLLPPAQDLHLFLRHPGSGALVATQQVARPPGLGGQGQHLREPWKRSSEGQFWGSYLHTLLPL